MKKNILTSFVALAALSFAFTSCNQDNIGPKFEGDLNNSAAFTEAEIAGEVDPENLDITVPVYRISAKGAATIKVVCESNIDGIEVDPSVSFEDGEYESAMNVKVTDINKLNDMKKYRVTLRFPNENALPSSGYGCTVAVQIKPSYFGIANYDPWLFTGSWDVEVLKAKSGNYFRLVDAIEEGYNLDFTLNGDATEIDVEDQPTGYVHPSYGMVWWVPLGTCEYFRENHVLGIDSEYQVSAGSFGNGVDMITFDKDIIEGK